MCSGIPTVCCLCCSEASGGHPDIAGRVYRWLLDSPWASKLQSGVELRPGYSDHAKSSDADTSQERTTYAAAESASTGLRGVQVTSVGPSTPLFLFLPCTNACPI